MKWTWYFRMFDEPALDGRCFVGSVVVHDQMDFRIGALFNCLVDMFEEAEEFLMSITLMATSDHFAGLAVQGANNDVVP